MLNRRKFLKLSALTTPLLYFDNAATFLNNKVTAIVLSTWAPNVKANAEAWKILGANGKALDAVEAGVRFTYCVQMSDGGCKVYEAKYMVQ